LNQQQLQIARAALWHQNAAPLDTYDDVAPWFEEIGFCLFLPRHAQFPAPAPSLVEACIGAPSATPPPAAIGKATELATRLIDAQRAIPLNLLGTFSEQPDFLIAPEVLPWVAAIRGDRQWKTAPGARTAPIVLRTWEALEKNGAQTAVELREALGREVTEAAVLRALIELWTTVRALPVYTAGEPTRWLLMKERYAAQLATGSNTAQPTALSALASLYLRSAVAATAEEAEVFLSPLTARSRIREVLHGMTAARQLGTMSVGSHTLLFVEGSLPEVAPIAEEEPAPAAPPAERKAFRPRSDGPPRRDSREGRERRPPRPERPDRERGGFPPRREFRPAAAGDERSRGERPRSDRPRGEREGRPARPFEKKRTWEPRERGAKFRGPRPEGGGAERPRGEEHRGGREDRGERKPWQQRPGSGFQKREGRPPFRKAPGERPERPAGREDRGERKPWQQRPAGGFQKREGRPPFRKPAGERSERPASREERGERKPWQKRPGGEGFQKRAGRPPFRKASGERPERGGEREERPRFGKGPRPQFGKGSRPQFRGKRFEDRPPRREEGGDQRPPRPGKKFGGPKRFGKPGERAAPKSFGGNRPERGGRGAFRPGQRGRGQFKPSSRAPRPNPRKNRGEKPTGEEGTE
jgi:hypothetical protein